MKVSSHQDPESTFSDSIRLLELAALFSILLRPQFLGWTLPVLRKPVAREVLNKAGPAKIAKEFARPARRIFSHWHSLVYWELGVQSGWLPGS